MKRSDEEGRMVRVAAFDMDGTLLEEKSSWEKIHAHFNTVHVGQAGLKLYSEGKIDYQQWMKMDIAAWPRRTHISEIEDVLKSYTVREDARSTIERLRHEGFKVAMITAGLDVLAKKVANDLGLDAWVGNGLKVDADGRLTGEGEFRVDPLDKVTPFQRLLNQFGARNHGSVAVGDTKYDLPLLKAAWKGFLIGEETNVDSGVIRIERLSDIFLHI